MPDVTLSYEQLKQFNAEVRGLKAVDFRNQPAFKLDCLGHKVFLCRPQQIQCRLNELESQWLQSFQDADNKVTLSWAMAKFYFGFLQIQPFNDGNQRTALKFLCIQLNTQEVNRRLGIVFRPNDVLKKIPLDGDFSKDLPRLANLFCRWLKPVQ